MLRMCRIVCPGSNPPSSPGGVYGLDLYRSHHVILICQGLEVSRHRPGAVWFKAMRLGGLIGYSILRYCKYSRWIKYGGMLTESHGLKMLRNC